MKNNTAVVSHMLSLMLWKNSPENYFSPVSYSEFSSAAYKNLTKVKLLVLLRPQSMLLKNTVLFFCALPSGCVHLLSPVYKFIKLRVIFLLDVCIVLSSLGLSK